MNSNGLSTIRAQCLTAAPAIRWACVLEATAPKPGNVFPGQSFKDLAYVDFVMAADIAAGCLADPANVLSERVLNAARRTRDQIGTNVNLGILLMLGPLVDCDMSSNRALSISDWQSLVSARLNALDSRDSERFYQAIRLAKPGGMDDVKRMDLRDPAPENFLDAMRAARNRDRIAENYASGFADLFERVVPLLSQSIDRQGDLLAGITSAHVRLLATAPDSLILRKYGPEVAAEVQQQAQIDPQNWQQVRKLDQDLRNHTAGILNPGTSADLLAAALYVLLRTTGQDTN